MRGIDVSSWQHPGGAEIDWEEVASSGITFAIVKSCQGTDYVNPWCKRDLSDARAAGLLVGAYGFVEAGQDPTQQGNAFTASVLGEALELGFWIDWEIPETQPWQASQFYDQLTKVIWEARPDAGTYVDESWATILLQANCPIRRKWLALPDDTPVAGPTICQLITNATVPGITGLVDVDVLMSTRGINLPSAPKPRPAERPSEVRSAVPHQASDTVSDGDEEDEAPEALRVPSRS